MISAMRSRWRRYAFRVMLILFTSGYRYRLGYRTFQRDLWGYDYFVAGVYSDVIDYFAWIAKYRLVPVSRMVLVNFIVSFFHSVPSIIF